MVAFEGPQVRTVNRQEGSRAYTLNGVDAFFLLCNLKQIVLRYVQEHIVLARNFSAGKGHTARLCAFDVDVSADAGHQIKILICVGRNDVSALTFVGFFGDQTIAHGIAAAVNMLVKGIEVHLGGGDRNGSAGLVVGGLLVGPVHGLGHPADEGPIHNLSRVGGQGHAVAHIGVFRSDGLTAGNILHHSGRSGPEVDLHGAVGVRLHGEDVAVLGHNGGALQHLIACNLIALVGRSSDNAAVHGNTAIFVVVGNGGHFEALALGAPGGVDDLNRVHVAVAVPVVLGGLGLDLVNSGESVVVRGFFLVLRKHAGLISGFCFRGRLCKGRGGEQSYDHHQCDQQGEKSSWIISHVLCVLLCKLL